MRPTVSLVLIVAGYSRKVSSSGFTPSICIISASSASMSSVFTCISHSFFQMSDFELQDDEICGQGCDLESDVGQLLGDPYVSCG